MSKNQTVLIESPPKSIKTNKQGINNNSNSKNT